MKNNITDAWEIHNRIMLYFIDAIPESHYSDIMTSKGRSAGEQLAHIHNVRLMWLKAAAPDLESSAEKLDKEKLSAKDMKKQFEKSGKAIATLFERALAEKKLKGFKPHPEAFLGYLISHESHHRSQAIIALKQAGHPVDKKILFGLWEWGTK